MQSAPVFVGAALDVLPGLRSVPLLRRDAARVPVRVDRDRVRHYRAAGRRGHRRAAGAGRLRVSDVVEREPAGDARAPLAFSLLAFVGVAGSVECRARCGGARPDEGHRAPAARRARRRGSRPAGQTPRPSSRSWAVRRGRRRRRAGRGLVHGAARGGVPSRARRSTVCATSSMRAARSSWRRRCSWRATCCSSSRPRGSDDLSCSLRVAAGVGAVWFVGGHGATPRSCSPRCSSRSSCGSALTGAHDAGALRSAPRRSCVAGAWFREVAGLGTGAALLALAALALLGGFGALRLRSTRRSWRPATLGASRSPRASCGSTPRRRRSRASTRSWRSACRSSPADALVFTSLTGGRITSDEGWNYYSAVSGRQHYIAGWANSELRVRPAGARGAPAAEPPRARRRAGAGARRGRDRGGSPALRRAPRGRAGRRRAPAASTRTTASRSTSCGRRNVRGVRSKP